MVRALLARAERDDLDSDPNAPRLTHRHLQSGHRAALVDQQRWPESALWPAFDRLVEANASGPQTRRWTSSVDRRSPM